MYAYHYFPSVVVVDSDDDNIFGAIAFAISLEDCMLVSTTVCLAPFTGS
jgi:hypothetical protein